MKQEHNEVISSGDREVGLHNLACKWETNLELLGATAVEDKLQDKVKETIEKLLQA